MKKIILASGSPRRKALLEQAGLSFSVVVSNYKEVYDNDKTVDDNMRIIAAGKAWDVADRQEKDCVVIGADTIVCVGDEILGKPKDAAHAIKMLKKLSGREHFVYTGLAVIEKCSGICRTHVERTGVTFKRLDEGEITAYVETGEPFDKAGAYAVQGKGAVFIKNISGDYNNVVGLPLYGLFCMLKRFNIKIM
ncbi:MAG: Maf family protein [Firmicutes bacterium]|nr:Maf family protein [Bacillota bacterium]